MLTNVTLLDDSQYQIVGDMVAISNDLIMSLASDISPVIEVKCEYDKVFKYVCQYYNVPVDLIRDQNRRNKNAVHARKVAAYIFRIEYELSYPEIADIMYRYHTSIMAAVHSVNKNMTRYSDSINTILERCRDDKN